MIEGAVFAACAPGLEALLAAEIAELDIGVGAATPVAGGVELTGDLEVVYRCNLELGLASRVLVRVGAFDVRRLNALARHTAALPWEPWIGPGQRVRVRATCRRSRLYHTGAVAERVMSGIDQRVGGVATGGGADDGGGGEGRGGDGGGGGDPEPAVTVVARIERDHCVLSVDTSGDPLHRRGYRQATAKAPLREDLARAVIAASGWDGVGPLWDPFAGAGTIAIEAALVAARVPPGEHRRFAFLDAPGFDATAWERVRARAAARRRDVAPGRIGGSDRDRGAVEAATANAARAGVGDVVRFVEAPMSSAPVFAEPPAGAGVVTIATNPPYGMRIGDRDGVRRLYRAFGARVRALPGAWTLAMVCPSRKLAGATGLRLDSALLTDHGGTKVYILVGRGGGDEGERGEGGEADRGGSA